MMSTIQAKGYWQHTFTESTNKATKPKYRTTMRDYLRIPRQSSLQHVPEITQSIQAKEYLSNHNTFRPIKIVPPCQTNNMARQYQNFNRPITYKRRCEICNQLEDDHAHSYKTYSDRPAWHAGWKTPQQEKQKTHHPDDVTSGHSPHGRIQLNMRPHLNTTTKENNINHGRAVHNKHPRTTKTLAGLHKNTANSTMAGLNMRKNIPITMMDEKHWSQHRLM